LFHLVCEIKNTLLRLMEKVTSFIAYFHLLRIVSMKAFILIAVFFVAVASSSAQRIAFIDSKTIREKFPEAKQAEQRLQSMVDDWKRELDDRQRTINTLEEDIKKNRLVWTDDERVEKDEELTRKRKEREDFATKKFGPNGEYDAAVGMVFRGVEEKIYAAVQEAALDDNYDIVWDKSTQPLVFINTKYDLTVKTLKKLGVNVEDMEEQQKKQIESDPRNKQKDTKTPAGTRRRTRPGDTDQISLPKDTSTEPEIKKQ